MTAAPFTDENFITWTNLLDKSLTVFCYFLSSGEVEKEDLIIATNLFKPILKEIIGKLEYGIDTQSLETATQYFYLLSVIFCTVELKFSNNGTRIAETNIEEKVSTLTLGKDLYEKYEQDPIIIRNTLRDI